MKPRRYIPPPPGVDPDRWRVPGEAEVIAKLEARITINAMRVKHRHRLGMELDDIKEEIRLALLMAIRRWGAKRGTTPPPGAFLTTVMQRRVMHFNRSARTWFRMLDEMVRATWDDDQDLMPRAERVVAEDPSPVDAVVDAEEAEAFRALIYSLRQNLPPAAFAILHLRIVEELTPEEIAAIAGLPTGTLASKRIGYAKKRAWVFLQSLGIDNFEQARLLAPGDIDAET